MTKQALIRMLHQRKQRLGTWKALADSLGVTQQYLQDIKDARREPGTLLLNALGMVKVVDYRRASRRRLERDSEVA